MLRTRLVAGVTSGFVLSAVFATVLTVARFGDVLVEPLRVDPARPAPVALRLPRSQRPDVRPEGPRTIQADSVAIPRGAVVKDESLAARVRKYEQARRPPRATLLAAQWLLYFLAVLMVTSYMRRAGSDRAGLLRAHVSLLGLALGQLLASKALLLLTPLPEYLLPVSLIPLWAALHVDRRTGVALALLMTSCTASLTNYDPIITSTYLVSSIGATLSFRYRKRASLLTASGLLGGLLGAVVYVASKEIYVGFHLEQELDASLWSSAPLAAVAGGALAGLLAYGLHAPIARMLGIVSRSELLNLSDLEQPLLQRMADRAPGSWEHSRMMANLAEAAAASIGADALLTRVGAYYHDLGKSVQPKYFVENLRRGETSPHNDLPPDVSADAIMAHVVEGVRILREGGIPEAVVEFAYTHHGTSVIEFFWHKCKKEGNPKELTEEAFRYPGMRPRTKETGILMLIDAIEAGARTVEPPTRKKFSELVKRVIFSKLQQGQLDEAGLTMEELRIVTARITDSLCSAYHSRIRYPWQEDEDAKKAETGSKDVKERPSTPPPAEREDPSGSTRATGKAGANDKAERESGETLERKRRDETPTARSAAERKSTEETRSPERKRKDSRTEVTANAEQASAAPRATTGESNRGDGERGQRTARAEAAQTAFKSVAPAPPPRAAGPTDSETFPVVKPGAASHDTGSFAAQRRTETEAGREKEAGPDDQAERRKGDARNDEREPQRTAGAKG